LHSKNKAMAGDFDYSILNSVRHRPWPMPDAPWVMTQSWHDLLFAHWPVDLAEMRALVPDQFELDVFNESAWLSVVPFHMTNVSPRGVPALPRLSAFPELNVRTYVRVGERPGIYFFSLDAGSWPAVEAANLTLNLPYFHADMDVKPFGQGISYASTRKDGGQAFRATYAPSGEPFMAKPGSLARFLTERYCLYHLHRSGSPYRLEIHHPPWQLQEAHADITVNTVATTVIPSLTSRAAVLHFARRQDVVVWTPTEL
jgi:uncharacterized protein YqjF (DUF2071 family)